jgi:hypothetical protein
MKIKISLSVGIAATCLNAAPLGAQTPAVAPGPALNRRAPTDACTGQPVLTRDYIGSGKSIPAGPHVFALRRSARFDVQLVGGGGGGGAGRAAKESLGGGGGGHAIFLPIVQHVDLERDRYLIAVGGGGAGGLGAWHFNAPPSLSDGHPGGDTRLIRCSSGAVLVLAKGGSGGSGDSAHTGDDSGIGGEDFTDDGTHAVLGRGGTGGFGVPAESGRRGGDGANASGFGAGGGGQGKTDLQIDHGPRSHGGNGADGFAKLTGIGR